MGKKQDDLLTTFDQPADLMVESILNDESRKRQELQLSAEERRRLIEQRRKAGQRKEKERLKAQQQNKVLLALPTDLDQELQKIAAWQQVTKSQVTTFLLYEALERFQHGEISFEACKHISYNPRYGFELIHPSDTERQNRHSTKKRKYGWG